MPWYYIAIPILICLIFEIGREKWIEYKKKQQWIKQAEELREDVISVLDELYTSEEKGEMGNMEESTIDLNHKTLADLVDDTPVEEGYEQAINLLGGAILDSYEDYKFTLLRPAKDDYLSGYGIRMVYSKETHPALVEALFKLAVKHNLQDEELAKRLGEELADNRILEIGDVIVDAKSSGVSSIVSGDPITVFITFEPEEYIEKRKEAEAKQKAEREEAEEKRKEQDAIREEGYKQLLLASELVNKLSEELVAEHPEFMEAYEDLKSKYL